METALHPTWGCAARYGAREAPESNVRRACARAAPDPSVPRTAHELRGGDLQNLSRPLAATARRPSLCGSAHRLPAWPKPRRPARHNCDTHKGTGSEHRRTRTAATGRAADGRSRRGRGARLGSRGAARFQGLLDGNLRTIHEQTTRACCGVLRELHENASEWTADAVEPSGRCGDL